MRTKLFLTGLALMATTTMLNAQQGCRGQGKGQGQGQGNGICQKQKGTAYVDADKNGICDNAQKGKMSAERKSGQGKGKGTYFVDANKNGICDKQESGSKK